MLLYVSFLYFICSQYLYTFQICDSTLQSHIWNGHTYIHTQPTVRTRYHILKIVQQPPFSIVLYTQFDEKITLYTITTIWSISSVSCVQQLPTSQCSPVCLHVRFESRRKWGSCQWFGIGFRRVLRFPLTWPTRPNIPQKVSTRY